MSGHRRRPPQRLDGGTRAGRGRSRRRAPQKKRWIDYPRRGRTGPRRWLPSVRQLLGLFLFFVGGTAAAVGYAYATVTVPDPDPTTLLQNNVYYWSDGTVLATDGSVNRQNVSLAQVPADVQGDFIAAENASFYTDPGVDPKESSAPSSTWPRAARSSPARRSPSSSSRTPTWISRRRSPASSGNC
ncbi:hypothetical protein ACRAWF_27230 [Streptomyces sp. L7]